MGRPNERNMHDLDSHDDTPYTHLRSTLPSDHPGPAYRSADIPRIGPQDGGLSRDLYTHYFIWFIPPVETLVLKATLLRRTPIFIALVKEITFNKLGN